MLSCVSATGALLRGETMSYYVRGGARLQREPLRWVPQSMLTGRFPFGVRRASPLWLWFLARPNQIESGDARRTPNPPPEGRKMTRPARPEVLALLADVKENPDDLTPWLVLTDWL